MIKFLVNNSFVFVFISIILFFYSIIDLFILKNLRIDVIPDLSDKQVIIYTEYMGQTPQIVHDQVSYVIASNMMGLPGVKSVRSYSMPNFSLVYVIFNDNIDIYYARNRVLERLNTLNLPNGVTPLLGPDATGVGWAYQYVIISNTKNLSELWDFQNFYLKYILLSLPNVSEVASVGGYQKEFRIFIDPYKLYQYKISLKDIVNSIESNNISGSGKYLEISEKQVLINTNGYIKSINDIMKIKVNNFLKLRDIAYISEVPALRMGVADYNGDGQVVGGIVVIRYSTDTYKTLELIKQKISEISQKLKDIQIIPVYDRSILIEETIKGLFKDIIKEMIITIIVVSIFLYSLRGSLIILYFMLFSTVIGLYIFNFSGINSNIMSLGGVMLAIGTMIDAGIVITENYYRNKNNYLLINTYLTKIYPQFIYNIFLKTDYKKINSSLNLLALDVSFKEVGIPIFNALLIVALSFLPFMFLHGQTGKLFSPLVITKTLLMLIGALFSIFLVIPLIKIISPITNKFILKIKEELINIIFEKIYEIIFKIVMKLWVVFAVIPILAWFLFFNYISSLKTEFMPYLREYTLMYMPTTIPSISIDTAYKILQYQDKIIKSVYEVDKVFGKAGRANSATDPAPLSMIETIITLKPKDQWRKNLTYEDIINELDSKLQIPGVVNGWTQPIKGRTDMVTTGIRTPLGIKIYSDNLDNLFNMSIKIENNLKKLDEFITVYAEKSAIHPYLVINYNRDKLFQYNLNINDIQEYFDYLFLNKPVSTVIDGIKRYNISLSVDENYKNNLLNFPLYINNEIIRLSDVCDIKFQESFSEIKFENGFFVNYIYLVPKKGVDLNLLIKKIDKVLNDLLTKENGTYFYEYSGDFKYWLDTINSLKLVLPLVFIIIVLLVYITFNDIKDVLLVFYLLPCSLIGSVIIMKLLNYNLSVASIAGIVATLGISVEMLIIMILYIKNSLKYAKDIKQGIFEGAVKRVRPKLMTAIVIIASLTPILYSQEMGSEVLSKIVAPMIGGTISSFITALIFIPPIYLLLNIKKTLKISQKKLLKIS